MEVNLTDWLGDNSWAIWLSLAFLLGVGVHEPNATLGVGCALVGGAVRRCRAERGHA